MLAFNSTFVLHQQKFNNIRGRHPEYENFLQHMDKHGNLIKEYFHGIGKYFSTETISKKEVCYVTSSKQGISVINLETDQEYFIKFQSFGELIIHRFPDSEFYCVYGRDPDLKLSYFHVQNVS